MNYINNWNIELANRLAQEESINMTSNHWEIIHIIRNFYLNFNITPSMRILMKILSQNRSNKFKFSSRYLFKLFSNDPIKKASKIAGVPISNNCI